MPEVVDRKTLLSFCLVSKQALLSAQALLYRQPFIDPNKRDETALKAMAQNIVEALEFNNNYLGRFVRKTSGISNWLSALERFRRSSEGRDETKIWYHRILRACPQLQQVDISFTSSDDLEELLEILVLLRPTVPGSLTSTEPSSIRDITFSRRAKGCNIVNWMDYAYLLEILERTSIRSLDDVTFDATYWNYSGARDTEAQLPFSVKNLQITSLMGSLSNYIPLLPLNSSALDSFVFFGKMSCRASVFGKLPSFLPPTLTTLYLCFMNSTDPIALSEYGTPSDCPSISIEIFHSFPNLTYLYLCHTAGPSIELLELLVTSSPSLSRILFDGSVWVSNTTPPPTDIEDLFPEFRVLAILQQFQHLVEIHLGVLPTRSKVKYEGLKNSLKANGIEVAYEVCMLN